MYKFFFALILLFLGVSCKSQKAIPIVHNNGGIIRMPDFYTGIGIILNVQPNELAGVKNYSKPFTPVDSDLLRAETLCKEQFVAVINERNGNQSFDPVKDKDLYKDWNRQYVSFTDSNNNKIIFIELFSCCHKNKSKCFPDWKTKLIFLLDENPCTKDARFIVNLTSGKVTEP